MSAATASMSFWCVHDNRWRRCTLRRDYALVDGVETRFKRASTPLITMIDPSITVLLKTTPPLNVVCDRNGCALLARWVSGACAPRFVEWPVFVGVENYEIHRTLSSGTTFHVYRDRLVHPVLDVCVVFASVVSIDGPSHDEPPRIFTDACTGGLTLSGMTRREFVALVVDYAPHVADAWRRIITTQSVPVPPLKPAPPPATAPPKKLKTALAMIVAVRNRREGIFVGDDDRITLARTGDVFRRVPAMTVIACAASMTFSVNTTPPFACHCERAAFAYLSAWSGYTPTSAGELAWGDFSADSVTLTTRTCAVVHIYPLYIALPRTTPETVIFYTDITRVRVLADGVAIYTTHAQKPIVVDGLDSPSDRGRLLAALPAAAVIVAPKPKKKAPKAKKPSSPARDDPWTAVEAAGDALVAAHNARTAAEAAACAECVVCMDERTQSVALLPCGHATFCAPCARRLHVERSSCPVCREPIVGTLVLFQ